MADLVERQQEQDRRHRPASTVGRNIAPRLAVVAAFRVRLQAQRADHRRRGLIGVAQVDQAAGSLGVVATRPGWLAIASYQAASAGFASRHGSCAKRRSR